LLFVFQFCGAVWFWVLLTGSLDELCGLLPALFQAVVITHLLWGLLPFQLLFTESSWGDQLFASLPFSGALTEFLPPLLCASFQFVFYSVGFFAGVSVCPGGYGGLSQEWLGEYHVMLGANFLVC
jgi:hypothetical protein